MVAGILLAVSAAFALVFWARVWGPLRQMAFVQVEEPSGIYCNRTAFQDKQQRTRPVNSEPGPALQRQCHQTASNQRTTSAAPMTADRTLTIS